MDLGIGLVHARTSQNHSAAYEENGIEWRLKTVEHFLTTKGMKMQYAARASRRASTAPYPAGVQRLLPLWAVLASIVAFVPPARAQTFTTFHTFTGADGAYPYTGLVQASAGGYVGTTRGGGANDGGVVFVLAPDLAPDGSATTLYSFCAAAQCADGSQPVGGLVQGRDGDFYGTTYAGGTSGYGTVFKLTSGGVLSTLHSFAGSDGASPNAGLIHAADGNFYGTTSDGGPKGYGTIFRITPDGALTTLHSFDGSDGAHPNAALLQAADGDFYGTTAGGGIGDNGTVFGVTAGVLTTLHRFQGTDGSLSYGALFEATDGNLYGTTKLGGASADNEVNVGTVFALSVGLAPFIATQPTAGAIGTAVRILGDNLTAATQVFFNDQPATFKVVSASEIVTVVPTGAATGVVEVVTPDGVVGTNMNFTVY